MFVLHFSNSLLTFILYVANQKLTNVVRGAAVLVFWTFLYLRAAGQKGFGSLISFIISQCSENICLIVCCL